MSENKPKNPIVRKSETTGKFYVMNGSATYSGPFDSEQEAIYEIYQIKEGAPPYDWE